MFSPPFVGVNGVNMTFLLPIHIYNIYLKSVLNTPKVGYSQWDRFESWIELYGYSAHTHTATLPISFSTFTIFGTLIQLLKSPLKAGDIDDDSPVKVIDVGTTKSQIQFCVAHTSNSSHLGACLCIVIGW